MSNFFLADRIKELSRVEGTNNIALDGAVAGFSSFADFFASGDVVFYAITDNVQYEIGSGVYAMDGSNRALTRNVIRSSDLNVGPYHVNATSNSGPTDGQNGYFHPVWLSRSAAISGVGLADAPLPGPYTAVSGYTFDEFPGQTFYHITEHDGVAEPSHAGLSGVDFNAASAPVSFSAGVKEVFVTYPGKTSVFNGVGLESDIAEPKHSGLAFWRNEQIINYSSDLLFDDVNNFVGLRQPVPQYALDIGGEPSYSFINVSGIIEGGSGILFSGGQLTYTSLIASGGKQLEPFLRNQLGDAADGLLQVSGLVDQFIGLKKQTPGTVFMGPDIDWCGVGPCDPDYPSFRPLVLEDLPAMGTMYVTQQNRGLDTDSTHNPALGGTFQAGMVAIYHSSGNITYDSGIFYDAVTNQLLINGDPNKDSAAYELDVRGELSAQSGHFDQLLFTDDLIRIGASTINSRGLGSDNRYTIAIGDSAANNMSGVFDSVIIGRRAGTSLGVSSGVVAIGRDALGVSYENTHVVAIGDFAGYGVSGVDSTILIGDAAGYRTSGVTASIIIGSGAADSATRFYNGVIVGSDAGANSDILTDVVALGQDAFGFAYSGIDSIAIGRKALYGSNDADNSVAMGAYAAVNATTTAGLIAIGTDAALNSHDNTDLIAIGNHSGSGAYESSNATFIGFGAGSTGIRLSETICIGYNAGTASSGAHNVYLGSYAGAYVDGENNIEIVASGDSELSFLGSNVSGKVSIGGWNSLGLIVGDSYQGKVGIGSHTNPNPDATLLVMPRQANDAAFIVRHQGSGSSTPYMMLQSGDSTTFFQVTNSGDVITSGCMNPSGGLLLPPITPADWMNTTTNRLYNDAGTLKFNGSTITVGGAYSWFLTNGELPTDEITDAQTVTISGVSGVDVLYDSTSNLLQISASGLSGVLQAQITASNYVFFAAASGEGGAAGEIKQMDQNSYLAISGVSGVLVDFVDRTDGINNSGIFVLGYDPNVTYTWSAGDDYAINGPIPNAQLVEWVGESGIDIRFDKEAFTFHVGASGLSGILQTQITDHLNLWSGYLSNEFGPILVSGISGIAAYASGQVDAFGLKSAASGIRLQDDTYILDHSGSGVLKRLSVDDNDSVIIGDLAGHQVVDYGSGVMIGLEARSKSSGSFKSVSLGYRAGYQAYEGATGVHIGYESALASSGSYGGISIGSSAGRSLLDCSGTINVGGYAGYNASGVDCSIFIGKMAGQHSNLLQRTFGIEQEFIYFGKGSEEAPLGTAINPGEVIGIGSKACAESEYMGTSLAIGRAAAFASSGIASSILLGNQAGKFASGVTRSILFGEDAGIYSSGIYGSVLMGWEVALSGGTYENGIGMGNQALWNAGRVDEVGIGADAGEFIVLGHNAAREANAFDKLVAIGAYAGRASSGCKNSVFIGTYAGQSRESARSIIISNKSDPPTGVYDADWSDTDQRIIDVADVFQGLLNNFDGGATQYPAIHIGRSLDPVGGDIDSNEIADSALNITSPNKDYFGLTLRFDPDATGVSTAIQADAMRSQVRNSTGTPLALFNTLINANGWINLPVVESIVGTGSNTEIADDLGHTIVKRAGVTVVYQLDQLGVYECGMAICVNDGDTQTGPLVWKKHEFTEYFQSLTVPI